MTRTPKEAVHLTALELAAEEIARRVTHKARTAFENRGLLTMLADRVEGQLIGRVRPMHVEHIEKVIRTRGRRTLLESSMRPVKQAIMSAARRTS